MSYALVAVAVVGAVSAGVSYQNGQQQVAATKQANEFAKESAAKNQKQMDEANNRVNQKGVDASGLLARASQSGKAGASGTMLTGAGGIDPNVLDLGRHTLLGS